MAQKKATYSLEDFVDEKTGASIQEVAKDAKKATYSDKDFVDTKGQLEAIHEGVPGTLEPGSIGDIANPIGSLQGRSKTGVVRSGVNLVGALGEAAEKAVGIDPNNQLKSLPGAALKMGQGMYDMLKTDPASTYNTISGLYGSVVDQPKVMKEGWDEKDPDKFITGLGGTAVTTLPTVAGIMEGVGAIKKGLSTPKQPQFDPSLPTGEVKRGSRPAQDFAKIHGGEADYDLRRKLELETYEGVKHDLKQSEKDLFNRPAKTTEEYNAIVDDAGKRIWKEYEQYLDQGSTINGNEVVERATEGYKSAVKANHPEDFATYRQKLEAAFKDKKLTPREAQERLSQLNAEAEGFYALNNASDMAAKRNLVGSQRYLSTADALRDILDEHLPEGAKNVRERYGYVAGSKDAMPMPSEAGKKFFAAMFDESAKAMSTRPGFAAMRGGLRAVKAGGTNKLVERMLRETPYEKNPATSPTIERTHPVTGEKIVGDRGPNAIKTALPNAKPSHPMSPREFLQGNHPLVIPDNPATSTGISGLNLNEPRVAPQFDNPQSAPLSANTSITQKPIHPPVVGTELPNVAKSQPPLMPHQQEALAREAQRMQSDPHGAIPTGLETSVRTQGGEMPHQTVAREAQELADRNIPASSGSHGISTGLNTSGRITGGQIANIMEPQTELTHVLNQTGMSEIKPETTRSVREFPGVEPDPTLKTQLAPTGGSGDVRYQSVKPANIPIEGMDRGFYNQFSQGLPSSGLPMQIPQKSMLETLGRHIGSNPLIKTGLRK